MFLLTEGTLFFLNLALSTRIRDRKPSLKSVVQTWANGVAATTDNSGHGADTTRASSTLYASSSGLLSATVAKTSLASSSRGVAKESTPQNAPMFSKTSGYCAKDHCHVFASSHPDDERHDGEEIATSRHDQASASASRMNSAGDRDSCSSHLAPLSQWQQEAPRTVKRKVDHIDVAEGPSQVAKMVGRTAKRGRMHIRPTKRAKHGNPSASSLSPPPDPSVGYVSVACIAHSQPLPRRPVDNEAYIIEEIKKRSEYTNSDLPVPCDQRWSHAFISTAILWYSVQHDIWNVPEEELTSALQCIFNVVYPGTKYRVTPAGSVFALVQRRINEWRSTFGSSALAMMVHFFSTLDNKEDIHAAAEFLSTDSRFLREDPDSSEPTDSFRSPFLHILIAITHLGDIAASVDVPGWDTRAMAAGRDGEGVIALASVALERALGFICDGILDVDRVLAEVPHCGDALTTMGLSTPPEAMPDTFTGHDMPPALQFSSANWSGPTAVYRESAQKRGAIFVRETFASAQARRRRVTANADSELGVDPSVSGVPDVRFSETSDPWCV